MNTSIYIALGAAINFVYMLSSVNVSAVYVVDVICHTTQTQGKHAYSMELSCLACVWVFGDEGLGMQGEPNTYT